MSPRLLSLRLVIPFLAALLGGCNFAPKYSKPTTPSLPSFKENPDWKVAQPRDHVLRGKWWEMYGDPELNALEEQAGVSNQNIAAAVANFLAARALVRQARSQFLPTVTASPSITRSFSSSSSQGFNTRSTTGGTTGIPTTGGTGISGSGNTFAFYSLPFDATWEPDFWGAIRNNVRAARYAAQSSAANLENVRLTAQAELAVDYYQLRGQDALKSLFTATIAADEKALQLTRTLLATGIDSDQSVALAETQLDTVLAQTTALDVQRAQLEHAIAMLAGKPASAFSIPVKSLDAAPPSIPASVPSELLERRPDIAAAERAVAQANAQIGVARAAFFPTVTLSGSAGFQSTSIANLFSGSFWSVGGALAQTLFDAGRRAGVTDQAWATYQQNVASYRQTVLTAFQEVEDNLAASRILALQLQQQQTAIAASQRNLDLANQRFASGIDSYLTVITAQTTLLNNQQTAVNIQIQQLTASVQLVKALGGGWNEGQLPPVKEVGTAPLMPH